MITALLFLNGKCQIDENMFVLCCQANCSYFFPNGPYLQSMMGLMCLHVCVHEDWEKVAFCVLCFKCVLSSSTKREYLIRADCC